MEILSYLRQQGRKGEIIHGKPSYIAERISILAKASAARKALEEPEESRAGEIWIFIYLLKKYIIEIPIAKFITKIIEL